MLAILSNTIENAGKLSDDLQGYWNIRGVYASVSLFENEAEFLEAMRFRPYDCVILEYVEEPLMLVGLIQDIHSNCKIAVVTDNKDRTKDNEIALGCYQLGVVMMLTLADFELPLAKLSKQLKLV